MKDNTRLTVHSFNVITWRTKLVSNSRRPNNGMNQRWIFVTPKPWISFRGVKVLHIESLSDNLHDPCKLHLWDVTFVHNFEDETSLKAWSKTVVQLVAVVVFSSQSLLKEEQLLFLKPKLTGTWIFLVVILITAISYSYCFLFFICCCWRVNMSLALDWQRICLEVTHKVNLHHNKGLWCIDTSIISLLGTICDFSDCRKSIISTVIHPNHVQILRIVEIKT